MFFFVFSQCHPWNKAFLRDYQQPLSLNKALLKAWFLAGRWLRFPFIRSNIAVATTNPGLHIGFKHNPSQVNSHHQDDMTFLGEELGILTEKTDSFANITGKRTNPRHLIPGKKEIWSPENVNANVTSSWTAELVNPTNKAGRFFSYSLRKYSLKKIRCQQKYGIYWAKTSI